MNLPTWLTFIRILFIPLVVVVFYLPYTYSGFFAGLVFLLAGITDAFDGYLARKYNQTTKFGAFLDPVADKLMVVVALALLIEDNNSIWITIPALIIIGREITISSLREWMAHIGVGNLPVSKIGKYKTGFQIGSIAGLLTFGASNFNDYWIFGKFLHYAGILAFYIAAFLTLWSLIDYLKVASPHFFKK